MRISDWSSDVCSSDLFGGGEDGVVSAHADIGAGMELGAALAHQDVAGDDGFAAELLHAEALSAGIAAVPGTAACLFMGHLALLLTSSSAPTSQPSWSSVRPDRKSTRLNSSH